MKNDDLIEGKFIDSKLQKFGITRKTVYATLSIVVAMVLIVVLSIINAEFKLDALKTTKFWTNFAILTGLSIVGMVMGVQSGKDMSQNNKIGAFRKSLEKFSSIFKKIDDIMLFAYFEDWLEIYRERKKKEKIERIIKDCGIKQLEVLDLDLSELGLLKNPYKKQWDKDCDRKYGNEEVTYFLSCTDEQIEIIKKCLAGKVRVSDIPKSFFTDATNQSEKDMWESASNASKKKGLFLGTNYLYRIVGLLAFSILFAGIGVGESGAGSKEMWSLMVTRIFCLLMSYFWGIFVGFEYVKIDTTYINFKTLILNQYFEEYQLKIFVPKTIDEISKEQYEKYEKEKNEILDNLVVPEVVAIENKEVTENGRSENNGRTES